MIWLGKPYLILLHFYHSIYLEYFSQFNSLIFLLSYPIYIPRIFKVWFCQFKPKGLEILFLADPIHSVSVLSLLTLRPDAFSNLSKNRFAEFLSETIAVVSSAYCDSFDSLFAICIPLMFLSRLIWCARSSIVKINISTNKSSSINQKSNP